MAYKYSKIKFTRLKLSFYGLNEAFISYRKPKATKTNDNCFVRSDLIRNKNFEPALLDTGTIF